MLPRGGKRRIDRPWLDYLVGGVIGLIIGLGFLTMILLGLKQGLANLDEGTTLQPRERLHR